MKEERGECTDLREERDDEKKQMGEGVVVILECQVYAA